MREDRKVVITGMGTVTAYGIGIAPYSDGLRFGSTTASLISSFDPGTLPTRFAGNLHIDEEGLEQYLEKPKAAKTMSRPGKFAMIAAQEAVKQSGINFSGIDPYRVGITLGAGGLGVWDPAHAEISADILLQSILRDGDDLSLDQRGLLMRSLQKIHPLSPLKALPNIPTAHIAIHFNIRGSSGTVTTACTSSAQAIGDAYRQIKFGLAEVMLSGGADSMINPNGVVAFSALGVLSKNNDEYLTASRPFDKRRDGFMIGEGAAIFVLEEMEHARKRGADILAEVAGFGTACDAYRLTDEPPDAHGSIRSMENALHDAEISPDKVQYINAHGTGTRINDRTETFAIKKVFGSGSSLIPPCSSTKSMLGHLVAAAGAVELAACTIAMRENFLPPTINYEVPDPECDLDYIPNSAREYRADTILSNSFGFGGQNASLILRKV